MAKKVKDIVAVDFVVAYYKGKWVDVPVPYAPVTETKEVLEKQQPQSSACWLGNDRSSKDVRKRATSFVQDKWYFILLGDW